MQGDSYLKPSEEILQYVEAFGLYFEQVGLPRTAGRILGWLLVCDPPHQTMHELVDVLQVSKSSISTASRILIQANLVDKISLPGKRRDYYQMNKNAWTNSWLENAKQTAAMREIIAQGLTLLANEPAERRQRLQDMDDFYAFLQRELPLLLERWKKERYD
jgi:predicted transcriptional regulator